MFTFDCVHVSHPACHHAVHVLPWSRPAPKGLSSADRVAPSLMQVVAKAKAEVAKAKKEDRTVTKDDVSVTSEPVHVCS